MDNYNFNENTLLHTCGYNLYSFVNILNNGIMSYSYAKENNIDIGRNFYGSNLEDTISCVRTIYINDYILDGAYNLHIKNGISFIIEDVDFIYDKKDRIIHRYDEVLVKDYINPSKIKGILIPESYKDSLLNELEYIKCNSTSYTLIKNNLDNLVNFINLLGVKPQVNEYNDYLRELYLINEAYKKETNNKEKESLKQDFSDVINDINYTLGNDFIKCFRPIIGDDVSLLNAVNYFNKNLPIYFINDKKEKKK